MAGEGPPSTSFRCAGSEDVDGWDKPGHDGGWFLTYQPLRLRVEQADFAGIHREARRLRRSTGGCRARSVQAPRGRLGASARWSRRRSARSFPPGVHQRPPSPEPPVPLGDAFRPDAQHHSRSSQSRAARSPAAAGDPRRPPRRPARRPGHQPRRQRVHRRRAHEARDEQIGRPIVDRVRVGELLHLAAGASRRCASPASSPRSGRA